MNNNAKVKLGSVARECRETWTGSQSGIPIVGLEHLVPGEIELKDWDCDIEHTFSKKFRKGQVLLGRRRVYLRKAVVAPCDGICSGDITVIEAMDGIMPELLPFVIQNDRFFDYAMQGSAGSLSPRVKWDHLKDFEFSLPPLEEQKSLADKLWAAYRLKESYKKLLAATEEMVKSLFIEMFGNPVTNNKGWNTLPIKNVAPEAPSIEKQTGKVWILNLDMIESNTGKVVDKVFENDSNLLSVAPFDEGNVLYSKLRPYLNKVVVPDGKGYATTELVLLRPNQELLNLTFFSHLLRGDDFVTYANSISTGTKMPRMPLNDLRKFPCILPPMEKQIEFEEIAHQADKSGFELRKSIDAIDAVIKSLINS
ncbi:MAG: hypothetical protein K5882_06610 [Bacteroidales bacterium]|nr:hypothetical protein [Bacteroidales bacterium]